MIVHVEGVLSADQVAEFRRRLAAADWMDGRVTAGEQSARAKRNLQVPEDCELARELGDTVLGALGRHPQFISAARRASRRRSQRFRFWQIRRRLISPSALWPRLALAAMTSSFSIPPAANTSTNS